MIAQRNAGVILNYDNSYRFETTSVGVTIHRDLDVDGHTNLDNVNVVGVTTHQGHVLPSADSTYDLGLTGTRWRSVYADTFVGDGSGLTGITASGSGVVIKHDNNTVGTAGTINFGESMDVSAISGGSVTVGVSTSQWNVNRLSVSGVGTIGGGLNVTGALAADSDFYVDGHSYLENVSIGGTTSIKNGLTVGTNIQLGAAGIVTASSYRGDGSQLTGISAGVDVGITTSLSGTFNASAGTPATINTLTGYSANDLVVEYTIYVKNGSDFQTQKLLAMRDGTTIHSTQFAVMFSSSLLVQCDATISSGNILLRATPETGVSGSTTYKIKREVM